jgi:hypothetical protein
MLDLFEELKTVVSTLNEQGLDYALCGGLAVSILAEPRATVDIDLLMPETTYVAAKDSLIALGYDIEASPMNFAGGKVPIRRLSKLDPAGDVLSIDMLLVTEATQEAWDSRKQMQWEAGRLSVVSREGLILLKRLRGSKQDEADIEKLSRK